MTSRDCASMAPLFAACLLGSANERPQQEIGGEWDIYSPAPSPPGCHGWLHPSIKRHCSCQGPSPQCCSLWVPLPSTPLPASGPGVGMASHCCIPRELHHPLFLKLTLLKIVPFKPLPSLSALSTAGTLTDKQVHCTVTSTVTHSPPEHCAAMLSQAHMTSLGHTVSHVPSHPLVSSSLP